MTIEYAYEKRDGVVYQLVPMPSDANYSYGSFQLYHETDPYTIRVLQNSGHLRVTVSPTQVTVAYVRAFLSGAGTNGQVAYTYTVAPPSGDTTPPGITGVTATPGSGGTATITWNTDEASDSKVAYGTTSNSLTQSVSSASPSTNHSVTLTGLTAGTAYYYRVTSRDAAGNSSTSPTPPATATFTTAAATTVTAFAASTVILSGTLRSGSAASLHADDNVYFAVNSTTSGTRTASAYGSFAGVPGTLSNLKITYKGKNSVSCTQMSCAQTIAIWRWTTNSWVQLDSRMVGTTEVQIANLAPSGTLANYISTTGELRVRVQSTRSSNFFSSWDLMQIVYVRP